MENIDAFYFGCWGPPGHYLYDVHHRNAERTLPKDFPCVVRFLDGGMLPPNVHRLEGVASLWHVRNWTILTFWDRSGDARSGSNSTFVLRNRHDFDEACRLAMACFPGVWERFNFQVTEAA